MLEGPRRPNDPLPPIAGAGAAPTRAATAAALETLVGMGFTDVGRLEQMLEANGGDVARVLDLLLR